MSTFNDDILEIVDFNFSTNYNADANEKQHKKKLHEHDYFEIFLLLEGTVSALLGNTLYELQPTQALIIPPGYKHLILPENTPVFRSMYFKFRLLPKVKSNLLSFMSTSSVIICNSSSELITHIHNIYHSLFFFQEDEFAIMVKGFTTQMVMLLYKYHNLIEPKTNNLHELTIHLIAYINQHLISPITLKSLSLYFNFNINYISRIFKKDMGITIMKYIKEKRLQLAKTLIYGGDRPMQAMQKSGHNDYPNFYKDFVKRYGISPKELWNQYKKDSPIH